ncbi:hypothetical protein CVT24_011401 [Panaeolus cyanescens]|uniref:F-box domain-containing protein n=1 Tax=Panaeolus cyanescens TaxID=181874 RepID=A0A409YGK7_9AGAR|nr:hypothetical protein CVT24_011401 [Panaeolus cyanescens]
MSLVQANSLNAENQEQPASSLPVEIIERIIDNLVLESRHRHLASCALVCRTWLHTCRRHIFSNVEVPKYDRSGVTWPKPQKHSAVIEVLNGNPSLLRYVRQVTYRTDNVYQEEGNEDPSISVLLHSPLVKKLSIECARHTSFESANERGSNFRSLLMHCISAGNLSHLSVTWIDKLPMNDILSNPSLECLVVRDCGYREEERSDTRHSPLKYLKINDHKNMSWSTFQSCRELETLIIGPSCKPPIADDCMVEEVFPNLKHFKLSASHWGDQLATVNQILGGVSLVEEMRLESK